MFYFKFHKDNSTPILSRELSRLIKVSTRPSVPSAEEIINEVELANGQIYYEHTGLYRDREIPIECNFVADSKEQWAERMKEIQTALLGDTGKLELSDDIYHYYVVKSVRIDDVSRLYGFGAEFTVNFVVDPFRYLNSYTLPLQFNTDSNGKAVDLYNPSEPAKPIIRFFKSSATTITITNNGKTFKINNAFTDWLHSKTVSYIDLDVENMTLIKYMTDGSYDYYDDDVSGAYGDLILQNGENELTFTAPTTKTYLYRRYKEL